MKNFKFILSGTALITFLMSPVMAADCTFSGIYIGAQLGYGTMKGETSNNNIKINLGASGIVGGLHAGYGKQFPNRFYIGLEAYGNLANTEGEIKTNNIKLIYKRENSFGAKFRPGVVFGNALIYGVAGIESSSFKSESNNNKDKSKRYLGFVPGIGVAFNATDHIVIGLETTHTFYEKKNNTKIRATDALARISYKW